MIDNTPKLSRSEQSRINGAKSHGPASIEGKARSSANALKHGFAATINNVLALEDKEVFELHVTSYRAAFTPQNYFEETLIDQLASINWRQARLAALETALLDAQLTVQCDAVNATEPDGDVDPYARFLYAWHALARKSPRAEDPAVLAETFDIHCLELVRRYITTLDRQYRNTLLNLRQYRKDFAPLIAQPAPKTQEAEIPQEVAKQDEPDAPPPTPTVSIDRKPPATEIRPVLVPKTTVERAPEPTVPQNKR